MYVILILVPETNPWYQGRRLRGGAGWGGHVPPNIPTGGDDILHVPPQKKFTEKSMIWCAYQTCAISNHLLQTPPYSFAVKLMQTSFHFNSTAKITPRMHQNMPFWAQKSKNFLGRGLGAQPPPPVGRGTPPPHTLPPSAPSAPRSSRLRRSTLAPSALVPPISNRNRRHWCTLLSRLKFSAIFLRHLVPWPSVTLR